MKELKATTAMAMSDAEMPSEVSSRLSTSVGKSKYSFRLFFFTLLSVLACAGALANVAAASTPSGEDQYIEKTPNGGGNTGNGNGVDAVDANGDGTVTQDEVEDAAKKNKKKKKADEKAADDEGATGATSAAGAGTEPPASTPVESVATSAKIGPFKRNTALALIAFALLIGGGAVVLNGRKPPLPDGAGTPPS
jgi:hypothetical protein